MINNSTNNTPPFLGYAEISNKEKRIPEFDSLFIEEPGCAILHPLKLRKQELSRKVIRHGFRTHNVGYFASRKNKALITYESSLEKHAYTVFESYPEINSYRIQPCGIKLHFLDKFRTVYPDFEVMMNDSVGLVDIRYLKNTHSPKFKARCQALSQYCLQRGYRYTVLTETELMTERRKNARLLLSYCNGLPHPLLLNNVQKWLFKVMPIQFDEVLKVTNAYPSVRTVIAGLILDGIIIINWDKPIHGQFLTKSGSLK
jgi:hypothetical protein